jgi:hypothetical protein
MTDVPLAPIILDASCLLNLYASGRFKEIAESLPELLVVSDYVVEQEALFITYKEPGQETFVDLAAELDDGEAITVSLAEHRGCCVANR